MNNKIQKVKTKLLSLGYIDNEWLDKYLKLLESNLTTKRNRRSTQLHHAIPVKSYWLSDKPYNRREAEKLAKQDADNFSIHLAYKDHLLIHSYLTLCIDLTTAQLRYESQADLRKQNGVCGAIAANKNYSGKYKRATTEYVQQYYSADEADEILNL